VGLADGGHVIDPDGPGATPELAVWCEAGWTLLARVDGLSGGLGYDAPAWTGELAEDPLAPVDPTSRASELLAAYYHVPVSRLQLRMWEGSTMRMREAGLSPSTPTTLRAAMGSGDVRVAMDAGGWAALVNGAVPSGAPCDTMPIVTANARVRIGLVVGESTGSCDPAGAWFGFGADTNASTGCNDYPNTAGGARLCGAPPQRAEYARFAVVLGR
ncbi:MAG: hypothetical protein M3Y87_31040, partial [Myxococcota bacterium]|nr:hypothetical protein [Myxococcota bacterium]